MTRRTHVGIEPGTMDTLLLRPYLVGSWQGPEFLSAGWGLPDPGAKWTSSSFSSLVRGRETLWLHTAGTGTFPAQTVDPDYNGVAYVHLVDSPSFDLSPFPSADDWHFRVRIWWRPSHILATLGGVEQEPETFDVYACVAGEYILVGRLEQPLLDPAAEPTAVELSRVEPDGGDARIGADGAWWYEQLLTPPAETQAFALGSSTSLRFAVSTPECDASGFGIGVERVAVEILRGPVAYDLATFPVHLHRSYVNSRRWI